MRWLPLRTGRQRTDPRSERLRSRAGRTPPGAQQWQRPSRSLEAASNAEPGLEERPAEAHHAFVRGGDQ